MKRILKKGLLIFICATGSICLLGLIIGALTPPHITSTISMPEEAYVNTDILKYRDAVLNNYQLYKLFVVQGEIIQLFEDDSKSMGFIYLNHDVIAVTFNSKPKVLKGDIIKVYVQYLGLYDYETVNKVQTKVPIFHVDHLIVVKESNN